MFRVHDLRRAVSVEAENISKFSRHTRNFSRTREVGTSAARSSLELSDVRVDFSTHSGTQRPAPLTLSLQQQYLI